MLAQGASVRYVLSNPIGGLMFNGNIYAASGCDQQGAKCTVGLCNQSVNGKNVLAPCGVGKGPAGPVSLAEFTLLTGGVDTYDITLINGVNVPLSMAPAKPSGSGGNAYFCQTAGSTSASKTGLQACSWKFAPGTALAPIMTAVTAGGAACSATQPCSGGQVCGVPFDPASPASSKASSCGTQLGWWTADELCGWTNNGFGAPINCSVTTANLYECKGTNNGSCYTGGTGNTCCGCPQWVVNGKALKSGAMCQSTNPQWTSIAQPFLTYIKNACPTAYSFPFDDGTATFTCSTPNPGANSPNRMDYTITVCPGGKGAF